MRGDSLAGLSSGFMLGHEVRGQEVNGDSFTADVLYNISEECINCRSLAWEFGQRRSAGRLRRSRGEVAFQFLWSDKGAGAAGDRAWPMSGSSAYTYSPGHRERREPAAALLLIPKSSSKGVREENGK